MNHDRISQLVRKLERAIEEDYLHPQSEYALDLAHKITDPKIISAEDLIDLVRMKAEASR